MALRLLTPQPKLRLLEPRQEPEPIQQPSFLSRFTQGVKDRFTPKPTPITTQPVGQAQRQPIQPTQTPPKTFGQNIESVFGVPQRKLEELKQIPPSKIIQAATQGPASLVTPEGQKAGIVGAQVAFEPFQRAFAHAPANVMKPLLKSVAEGKPLPSFKELLTAGSAPIRKLRLPKEERTELRDVMLEFYRVQNVAHNVPIDTKFPGDEQMATIGGVGLRLLMPDVYKGISKIIKTTGKGAVQVGKQIAKLPSKVQQDLRIMFQASQKGKLNAAQVKSFRAYATNIKDPKIAKEVTKVVNKFIKENQPITEIKPEMATRQLFQTQRPGIVQPAQAQPTAIPKPTTPTPALPTAAVPTPPIPTPPSIPISAIARLPLGEVRAEIDKAKAEINEQVGKAVEQGMPKTEAMRDQLIAPMSERLKKLQARRAELVKEEPTKEPLVEEAKKYDTAEEFAKANEDKYSGAVIEVRKDLKEIGFDESIFNQAIEQGTDAGQLTKLVQSQVGDDKDVGVYTSVFGENVRALVEAKRTLELGKTQSQLTEIWNKAQEKAPVKEVALPTQAQPKVSKFLKELTDDIEQQRNIYQLVKASPNAEAAQKSLAEAGYDIPLADIKRIDPLVKGGALPTEFEKQLTGEALDAKVVELSNNIRTAKFNEEAKGVITRVGEVAGKEIQKQRRGVVSDEQVKELANDLQIDPEKLRNLPKGTALNAEGLYRMKQELNRSAVAVREIVKKYSGEINKDKKADLKAILERAVQKHIDLQVKYTGIVAESGRALRANRLVADIDAQGVASTINELLEGNPTSAIDFKVLTDKIIKNGLEGDPLEQIEEVFKPTVLDKILEWWKSFLLTNPTTQMVNILGNLYSGTEDFLTKAVSIPISKFIDKEPITARGLKAQMMGATAGLQEGLPLALDVLKGKKVGLRARELGFDKKAIKGVKGEIIRTPFKMLSAMDELYRSTFYTGKVYEMAANIALKEGLKDEAFAERTAELVRRPTELMDNISGDEATYLLYQAPPTGVSKAILNLRNKIKVLHFIFPFFNTPLNVFKRSMTWLPLIGLGVKQPGAPMSQKIVRQMFGLAITAWFFYNYLAGNVTGGAPRNSAKRDKFYREGKIPYAVKIGDTWVSMARLEPLSTIFRLYSGVLDAYTDDSAETFGDKAALMAKRVSENLVDQTYLRGISDLVNAMTDPARHGTRYIQNLATTFAVPRGVAYVTRNIDDVLRETKDPNIILATGKKVLAQIPGVSKTLPPRLTAFGDISSRNTGELSKWTQFPTKKIKPTSPTEGMLTDLNYTPGFPSRKIGDAKLTNEQYAQLLKESGQRIKKVFEQRAKVYNRLKDQGRMTDDMKDDFKSKLSSDVMKIRRGVRNKIKARLK